MRILVVSPLFPPFADAESYVGGKFVQSLLQMGHDIQVISCSNVRLGGQIDSSLLWNDLKPITKDVPVPTGRSKLKRVVDGLRFRTLSYTAWVSDAVEAAKALHRDAPFDLIISRSLPWHAHLAGYWIARQLNIRWFANCNDPLEWNEFLTDHEEREKHPPDLNLRLWKKRILLRPDLLTFPSDRLRNGMLRKVKRTLPTAVLPHIGGVAGIPIERSEQFTIVHAGTFNIGWRPADTVLRGLALATKENPALRRSMQFLFVGPEDPKLKEVAISLGLSDIVRWTGRVSYETSLGYIASADVCVLVDCAFFDESMFLPSKLIDYLSARKPIVALSPAIGTISDLSREGGILRLDLKDVPGVARRVAELWAAFQSGNLHTYDPPSSLVQRFDSGVIGTSLGQLLERHFADRLSRKIGAAANPAVALGRP